MVFIRTLKMYEAKNNLWAWENPSIQYDHEDFHALLEQIYYIIYRQVLYMWPLCRAPVINFS